ncbi:hypothetical protein HMSSN036_79820 [Paenibacillus macerans]|nr:hypothetical protein HMSSN036_79820 [Paenibacillus macerans]
MLFAGAAILAVFQMVRHCISKLQIAPALGPVLDEVLAATEPSDRHRAVSGALVMIAERHNALGVAPQVPPIVAPFQVGINDAVRPYRVLNAGSYAEAAGRRSRMKRCAKR